MSVLVNTGSFYTIQYILSSLGVIAAQATPFGASSCSLVLQLGRDDVVGPVKISLSPVLVYLICQNKVSASAPYWRPSR